MPLGTTTMLRPGRSRRTASVTWRAKSRHLIVDVSGWSITLRASLPRTTAAAMNIDRAPDNRTYLMANISGLLVGDQSDSVQQAAGGGPRAARRQLPAAASRQHSVNGCEEQVGFRGALGVELHDVAGTNAFEELLDVRVAQADAAVRLRVADGRGLIGAVNAVAFLAQA